MSSRNTLVPVLALLLFAAPAAAQRVGKPAPEINAPNYFGDEEHISLAKLKNKIVVLVFFRTNDSASVDVLPPLQKIHKDYRRRGVEIIAFTPETEREKVENLMKGKELTFRVIFGGNLHELYEAPAFPHAYLIDTGGIIVWRGHAGDGLEERIKAQMRKTPPAGSETAALRAKLQKAEQLQSRDDIGRAYTLAREVADLAEKDSEMAEKSKTLKEKLEKAAAETLTRARDLAKKEDFEKAGELLAMLSVRFEGTDVARDADAEVARLRGSGTVKTALRKAIENAKGEVHNDIAAQLESEKRYREAINAYKQTTENHVDTPAAKAAQAAIDRINSDASVQAELNKYRSEEEAERWLDLGERFVRVQLYDLAKVQFEKVIKTHPDSSAATKARKSLEKLPKES